MTTTQDISPAEIADWALWPSLYPAPWARWSWRLSALDDGHRLPVWNPKFATGQDLWRHGMPRSISPDDVRLEHGERGRLIKAGPAVEISGIGFAAGREAVSVEIVLGAALGLTMSGGALVIELPTDAAGESAATQADVVRMLSEKDEADRALAYAVARDSGARVTPAAARVLPWMAGTLSVLRGAPTSTFSFILECSRSGFLTVRPAVDQLEEAEFRVSLDGGKSWSMSRPYGTTEFEPETMGIFFRLADGGVPGGSVPFVRGQRFIMQTRESAQVDKALRAEAATMCTILSVAEVNPILKYAEDLRQINAVLAAGAMLVGPRGIDASSTGSARNSYDEEIRTNVKLATAKLEKIAEGVRRAMVVPGGETYGVDSFSQPPQGIGMT